MSSDTPPTRRTDQQSLLAHYDRLQQAFDNLLKDLSTVWPKQDLDYVCEEVGHGEYSDALENLIALGLRNSVGFSPAQARQAEALAVAMGMETSSFLTQLRKAIGKVEP